MGLDKHWYNDAVDHLNLHRHCHRVRDCLRYRLQQPGSVPNRHGALQRRQRSLRTHDHHRDREGDHLRDPSANDLERVRANRWTHPVLVSRLLPQRTGVCHVRHCLLDLSEHRFHHHPQAVRRLDRSTPVDSYRLPHGLREILVNS